MSNVKIVINSAGIREFLKSQQVQNMLSERAEQISSKSGGEKEIYVAGTRAVAKVKGENSGNKLLKAVR